MADRIDRWKGAENNPNIQINGSWNELDGVTTWCNYCQKETPTTDVTDCTICNLSKTSENIVAQDAHEGMGYE